jgi:hypothetical protein
MHKICIKYAKKICRKICKKHDKYAKKHDKYATWIYYAKYARKYAEYAKSVDHAKNMQNMHSPPCWWRYHMNAAWQHWLRAQAASRTKSAAAAGSGPRPSSRRSPSRRQALVSQECRGNTGTPSQAHGQARRQRRAPTGRPRLPWHWYRGSLGLRWCYSALGRSGTITVTQACHASDGPTVASRAESESGAGARFRSSRVRVIGRGLRVSHGRRTQTILLGWVPEQLPVGPPATGVTPRVRSNLNFWLGHWVRRTEPESWTVAGGGASQFIINQKGMATLQEHRLGYPVPNKRFSLTGRGDVTPRFVQKTSISSEICEIYMVIGGPRFLFLNSTPTLQVDATLTGPGMEKSNG